MPHRVDLLHHADQALWISDDRISAQVSMRSGGIQQIDFHGVQPVSRNAKLLQHPQGVLTFCLELPGAHGPEFLALIWANPDVFPAGTVQRQVHESLEVSLQVGVSGRTLTAQCRCSFNDPKSFARPLRLRVDWNPASMDTEVHGQRVWAPVRHPAAGRLLLQATDCIALRTWLRRSGDYQGDFLIPEDWRRMIYKRRCISGTARFEDVKDEYQESSLNLYDADTYILLGGDGFALLNPPQPLYRFHADLQQDGQHGWLSPVFCLQFFTSEPPDGFVSDDPSPGNLFARQQQRYARLCAAAPQLIWPAHPAICEFFNRVPQIVESARVEDYGMTRACPGTYYWIWAWDNMVTAQALRHWGDVHTLNRMADFLRFHRDADGSIPGRWTRYLEPMDSRGFGGCDFLYSEMVLSLYAETQDKSFLRRHYTALYRAFMELAERARDHGLFPGMGMYPDLPAKMGRTETFYVAIDAGAWYALCRNLEKIAWMLDDQPTAGRAADMADRVERHFLPVFWDEDKGFLCDAHDPATGQRNSSYPLFSLLFLESAFGYALLKDQFASCSRFIREHLLGRTGVSLTPAWDRNHNSEPAMSAWYPHWDLAAMKVWMLSGDGAAMGDWLERVERCYEALGYCPEFLALDVPEQEKWQHHGAAWNLNCAAGWYNAILSGLVGIETDFTGITCRPTPVLPDARGPGARPSVRALRYRGGSWHIEAKGEGACISALHVDGSEITGSLKIPREFYTHGSHVLEIHYSPEASSRPVLRELWGAEVVRIAANAHHPTFTLYGFGCADLCFFAPSRPVVLLDNTEIVCSWTAEQQMGRCRLQLRGDHELALAGAWAE